MVITIYHAAVNQCDSHLFCILLSTSLSLFQSLSLELHCLIELQTAIIKVTVFPLWLHGYMSAVKVHDAVVAMLPWALLSVISQSLERRFHQIVRLSNEGQQNHCL